METGDKVIDRRSRTDRRRSAVHPLAGELAEAIERGLIEILYQPQFACDDGRLTGAEALLRWPHPLRGDVAGDALCEIAASAGLEEALSRHVRRTALRAAASWPAPLTLAINVTAADLAAPSLLEAIAAELAESGFDPRRLTLEITEQALVDELDRSAERLRSLASVGIRVALDDFGAGFCNFGYLKALPLHRLKLDRRMVEGIAADEQDLAVFRGIVTMAKALGLQVIAEGIETAAQREAVAREGCDAWQGYYGARPMGAQQFAELAGA